MAISRLPPVWLKIQVYKNVAATTVAIQPMMKGSEKVLPDTNPGTSKAGTCHKPCRVARMRVPRMGPHRCCKRGRAKPRQPISSPKAKARNSIKGGRYALTIDDG